METLADLLYKDYPPGRLVDVLLLPASQLLLQIISSSAGARQGKVPKIFHG